VKSVKHDVNKNTHYKTENELIDIVYIDCEYELIKKMDAIFWNGIMMNVYEFRSCIFSKVSEERTTNSFRKDESSI
jgi:hypothetical protein